MFKKMEIIPNIKFHFIARIDSKKQTQYMATKSQENSTQHNEINKQRQIANIYKEELYAVRVRIAN